MKRLALLLASIFISGTALAQDNWRDVEDAFRTTGKMLDSRTVEISIPRSDQTVMKGDTKLAPEFGLTTEIKFTGTPQKAMMMADLVLLEKEVNPVITQLQASGFTITALHNHLFGTDPNVLFLHVEGRGAAKGLATALKNALSQSGTPMGASAASTSAATGQWTTLQSALGQKGEQKGDVLEVMVPRKDKVTNKGTAVPPFFGAAHHLFFQKAGDKVATTGELVLLDKEVNQVAKYLRNNKFDITALHNHSLFENPRLFYLHFWATDTPEMIGRTLKGAMGMAAGGAAATVSPATSLPGGTPPIPKAGTKPAPSTTAPSTTAPSSTAPSTRTPSPGTTTAPPTSGTTGTTTGTAPGGRTTTPSTGTTAPSTGTTGGTTGTTTSPTPLPGGTPPIPSPTTPTK